jgi:hypothetical protein
MLYTVKLTYQIVVDARSASNAHWIACERMRKNPSAFISKVQMGSGGGSKKPLWQQLLFGT